MQVQLFGPNLLLVLGMLFSGLLTLIFVRISRQSSARRLILIFSISILVAFGLRVMSHFAFAGNKLPDMLWLMFVPFTLSVATLLSTFIFRPRSVSLILGSICLVIFGLGLSSLLINNAYHYFPTLASLVGKETRQQADNSQNYNTLLFDSDAKANQHTVEGDLLQKNNQQTKGTIAELDIPGTTSNFKARKGSVYIPAIATANPEIELPVIVLLAGVPSRTTDWIDGGELQKTMDDFASKHNGITPYVFMVDPLGSESNDTECVDSPRGNVETYLTKDVPTYIKANYAVRHKPQHWAIGGLSMGGMCGTMLTLRHTDTYNTFINFGGEIGPEVGTKEQTVSALFHGSVDEYNNHQPMTLLQQKQYPGIRGYFAVGKGDEAKLVADMKTLYDATQKAGIDSNLEYLNGDHSFQVWATALRDTMPALSNHLGATQCVNSCR